MYLVCVFFLSLSLALSFFVTIGLFHISNSLVNIHHKGFAVNPGFVNCLCLLLFGPVCCLKIFITGQFKNSVHHRPPRYGLNSLFLIVSRLSRSTHFVLVIFRSVNVIYYNSSRNFSYIRTRTITWHFFLFSLLEIFPSFSDNL